MSNTGLSKRQLEILHLRASGMCYKEIAAELHLSHQTVKNYGSQILATLGAMSFESAIIIAIRDGDLDPDKIQVIRRPQWVAGQGQGVI